VLWFVATAPELEHTQRMPASNAPSTARERARVEITQEILDTARGHLAKDGAASLSLRAVARDLGMVSSAIYRYVPNRDSLLTMLIIEAYNSLGADVEKVGRTLRRDAYLERFLVTCHAVRGWALAHPQEYALIYGSPVPGYAAPTDTIGPASRVPTVLLTILIDMHRNDRPKKSMPVEPLVSTAIADIRKFSGGLLPDDLLLRGMAAWSGLFGAVSFELYGHLHNVVAEGPKHRKAYFDHQMRQVAAGLGLG